MIRLERLNGDEFVLNAELIQYIEETPDTVITLTNGDKVIVKEPVDEVVQKAIQFGRSIRNFPT